MSYSFVAGDVRVENWGETTVVTMLDSSLHLSNIVELKQIFAQETDRRPRNLIVNLSNVTYADSAGMGLLFSLHRTMHAAKGNYALVDIGPEVAQILAMAHVQKIIKTFPTVEQAVDAFKSTEPVP